MREQFRIDSVFDRVRDDRHRLWTDRWAVPRDATTQVRSDFAKEFYRAFSHSAKSDSLNSRSIPTTLMRCIAKEKREIEGRSKRVITGRWGTRIPKPNEGRRLAKIMKHLLEGFHDGDVRATQATFSRPVVIKATARDGLKPVSPEHPGAASFCVAGDTEQTFYELHNIEAWRWIVSQGRTARPRGSDPNRSWQQY